MAGNLINQSDNLESDVDRSRADTVARLFRDHNRALVQYLALKLHSVQEAKEIAQEAYVRLLQLDRQNAESFLKNYLYRVATNLAVDRLRRRGYQTRYEGTELPDSEVAINAPERVMLAREQFDILFKALDELPHQYREALVLFRLEGLDQRSIAKRLGVQKRTVREYISFALRYCQERIDGTNHE